VSRYPRYPRPTCVEEYRWGGGGRTGGVGRKARETQGDGKWEFLGTVSNDGECLCHLKKRREFKNSRDDHSRGRKEKKGRRKKKTPPCATAIQECCHLGDAGRQLSRVRHRLIWMINLYLILQRHAPRGQQR
jgi:hypothetical protein